MGNVLDIAWYESDGVTRINHLTQWDKGQTICFGNIWFGLLHLWSTGAIE